MTIEQSFKRTEIRKTRFINTTTSDLYRLILRQQSRSILSNWLRYLSCWCRLQRQRHTLILHQMQTSHSKCSSRWTVRNDSWFWYWVSHQDNSRANAKEHISQSLYEFKVLIRLSRTTRDHARKTPHDRRYESSSVIRKTWNHRDEVNTRSQQSRRRHDQEQDIIDLENSHRYKSY